MKIPTKWLTVQTYVSNAYKRFKGHFFSKIKKNVVIVYIGESGLIGLLSSSSEWRKTGQSGYQVKSANKIASLKESTP